MFFLKKPSLVFSDKASFLAGHKLDIVTGNAKRPVKTSIKNGTFIITKAKHANCKCWGRTPGLEVINPHLTYIPIQTKPKCIMHCTIR